jgi:hypothetical protein
MDILTETQNLWQRFQRGGAFRTYLEKRLRLVIPALAIFVAYSVATTAGTVITLGGTRSILVFVGLVSAPVILLGSLYVLLFVFFLWLENRAIAHATHRVPKTVKQDVLAVPYSVGAVAKAVPLVMQVIGAAFLLVPLFFLFDLSPGVAILLLLLVLGTPAAYAALDR